MTQRRRMPSHVANGMTLILDYLWQDEARDYLGRSPDEQADHVFQHMLAVRQWLDRRDRVGRERGTKGAKSTSGKPLTRNHTRCNSRCEFRTPRAWFFT